MTDQPSETAGSRVQCSALFGVADCGLHRRTPYGMTNVSQSQFSIARYYGACNYGESYYIYLADTDELIRDDVLKWKRKQERKTPNVEVRHSAGKTEREQK